jgi:hypothetical protein
VHVFVEVEGGHHDHLDRVGHARSGQQPQRLEAVHLRHPDVEQRDVGA